MSEFADNIEKLIGQNRVEVAIEEFQKLLTEFKPDSDSGHAEARELKTYFIGLSQRLYQAKDNLKSGNITEQDLARERQKISNQMLETVFDLDKYSEFNAFINTKEEEFAWQNAKSLNTIAAYEEYFTKFPNQRYVQEPPKFLEELKNDLRQKAEAEKRRRTQDEKRPVQNITAPSYSNQSEPTPVKKSNSRMMMIIGAVVVVVIIIIIAMNSGKKSGESNNDAATYDSTAVDGSNDNSGATNDQNNSADQNSSVQQDNSQAGGDQNNSNDQGGQADSTQAQ